MRQVIANVVSLAVGIGVDLVSDTVVALIAIEADVVGAGSDPDGLAFKIEWSFPQSEMMSRSDNPQRIGLRISEILRSAEKTQFAHRQGHVGFFGEGSEKSAKDRVLIGAVDCDPSCGLEGFLHLILRSDEDEVHTIAWRSLGIADAPGNRVDQTLRKRGHVYVSLDCYGSCSAFHGHVVRTGSVVER